MQYSLKPLIGVRGLLAIVLAAQVLWAGYHFAASWSAVSVYSSPAPTKWSVTEFGKHFQLAEVEELDSTFGGWSIYTTVPQANEHLPQSKSSKGVEHYVTKSLTLGPHPFVCRHIQLYVPGEGTTINESVSDNVPADHCLFTPLTNTPNCYNGMILAMSLLENVVAGTLKSTGKPTTTDRLQLPWIQVVGSAYSSQSFNTQKIVDKILQQSSDPVHFEDFLQAQYRSPWYHNEIKKYEKLNRQPHMIDVVGTTGNMIGDVAGCLIQPIDPTFMLIRPTFTSLVFLMESLIQPPNITTPVSTAASSPCSSDPAVAALQNMFDIDFRSVWLLCYLKDNVKWKEFNSLVGRPWVKYNHKHLSQPLENYFSKLDKDFQSFQNTSIFGVFALYSPVFFLTP